MELPIGFIILMNFIMKGPDIVVSGLLFGVGGGVGICRRIPPGSFGKMIKDRFNHSVNQIGGITAGIFTLGAFIKTRRYASCFLGLCVMMQSMYLGPSIAVSHSLSRHLCAPPPAILFYAHQHYWNGIWTLVVGTISDRLRPSLID